MILGFKGSVGIGVKSIQITKVAHAAICFALNPAFIALGAVFFLKEKINRGTIIGILLGLIGIVTISLGDLSFNDLDNQNFLGDLFSIFAAIAFAIYFLIGKTMRLNLDNRLVMSIVYLSGAIFSLFLIFLMDLPLSGFTSNSWIALFVLAIFQTVLGHASIIYVLKFFKASFVSTFLLIEPLFAGIVAFFLFGEKITLTASIGYLLISLGIIFLFEEDIRKSFYKKRVT